MPDHERAMLAYATLAQISAEKRQLQGRDKFLVLAGAAACRAGWPDVANRCRALILENNPAHRIGSFPSFADAMRDDDFLALLKGRQRFCTYERAEHILQQLEMEVAPAGSDTAATAGDRALALLSACT